MQDVYSLSKEGRCAHPFVANGGKSFLYKEGKIKQNKRRETLTQNKDKAIVSKKLVTLKKDVPVKNKISEFQLKEIDKNKLELSNSVDTGLFKSDFEKNLYKKIQEIKKYFLNVGKNNDFEQSLNELLKFKQDVNLFFNNVVVNDENQLIKKNRLELLNLLCKSFDNFFNFSKIES